MKVKVNHEQCIGCGACQAICPDVFEFTDEGLMEAIKDEINKDFIDDVKDAMEGCPVDAIHEIKEQ